MHPRYHANGSQICYDGWIYAIGTSEVGAFKAVKYFNLAAAEQDEPRRSQLFEAGRAFVASYR